MICIVIVFELAMAYWEKKLFFCFEIIVKDKEDHKVSCGYASERCLQYFR